MISMHIKNFPRHRGFSLVEVMVGMVMGMIVLLVIMKAFALAEGYKRTTTSGTDSQVNGLLALRTLETEIRMAGYGITNSGHIMCPTINTYYDGAADVSVTGMPVKIRNNANPDGTASSYGDSIDVLYSSSEAGAAPVHITTAMPKPSNVTWVNTVAGFNQCDLILYASQDGSKACTLAQVTDTPGANPKILTGSGQSNYNPPGGTAPASWPTYGTSDIVINVGSFDSKSYSVSRNGVTDEFYLRVTNQRPASAACNGSGADPNPTLDKISNIVYMKAQYGVAPALSQTVSCWTSAAATDTGCAITGGKNWSNPDPVDVKRIKAIRYVVVARSQLKEKPTTGTTCDTTTATSANYPVSWAALGTGTPPTITLSGTSTDWQCYRYKAYQTIVPMINVLWSNT
jgi:type IV pilus assembly protein PilW